MANRVLSLTILAILAVIAFYPWDHWFGGRVDLAHGLLQPSLAHPLGTDNLGRDLLVRVAAALRGGVLPLWFGVTLASAAGVALAVLAILAAEARTVRPAVRAVDALFALTASIPIGLFAFAWAVLQERAGLGAVVLALAVVFLVRAYLETRDLFRHDAALAYWTAHQSLGGGLASRLWRYGVLADWRWSFLRALSFNLRAAVAIEASLSFLGFGIQEPQASFGNMLASHFDLYTSGHFEILLILIAVLLLTAAAPGAAVSLATRRASAFPGTMGQRFPKT